MPKQPDKPKKELKPASLPSGKGLTQNYYTNADGSTHFVVVRNDNKKPKGFTQWTPTDDPEKWLPTAPKGKKPLYLLHELAASTGKVAVVEGEKCVHACKEAWPNQTVTTFAGGAPHGWKHADWTPLAGREVALLADAEKSGHKAMQELAVLLNDLGCKVKIALPPLEWGNDVADWIAEKGKKGAAEIIGSLLQDYESPSKKMEFGGILIEDIKDNVHYALLGLVGTNIAIRLKQAGTVYEKTRDSFTQISTLVAIAPQAWWCSLLNIDKLDRDRALAIGDSLIREADTLGQIDQSMFLGRGAARLADGRIAYHLGDRLLLDGNLYGLNDDRTMVWLAEPRIELADEATASQVAEVARAVMSYRWATADDGKRFLGWVVAAIVGGALEWRPHLLLTAPAGEGKTWLLKQVLEKLMGTLMISVSDASTAAISKVREHAALPVAIDEAEPSEEWVIELLKTLRAASSDFGARIRVGPGNHGVVFQRARFCALLAGTVAPALARADDTRLTSVSFGAPVENWAQVKLAITTTMQKADMVRARIIRHTTEIVKEAERVGNEMQDLGMDSREALTSAALTAGWHFWGLDSADVYSREMTRVKTADGDTILSDPTDASDALLEILAVRVRPAGESDKSVLEMLSNVKKQGTLADLVGIRRTAKGELVIANRHKGLSTAMARTKWANADLRKLMLQLPDTSTTENTHRFGNLRLRAVLIPKSTLESVGVDIVEVSDDDA